MKVLHVTFSYAPDPMGGTEIYVGELCQRLEKLGARMVIAAPGGLSSYEIEGLRVHRFPYQPRPEELDALYGGGDPIAADAFEAVLDAERPDLVHQHALTPACSGELVARARRRNLPVVFTYHTPTVSCQRGTMLRWGSDVCDGRLDAHTCSACTLHGLGLNRTVSRMLASTPQAIGEAIAQAGLSGGGWTALRLSTLMRRRHEEITRVLSSVDRIVVLADWVREVLLANGVPESRMVRAPHGVARTETPHRHAWDADNVRLAHLGRIDASKGTGLLIAAVRSLPDAKVTLDVFGITQSDADRRELDQLRHAAGGDSRIRFLPPIPHVEIGARLAAFDAVVVPSQLLETGPLVVLEAFAAGVPVIGSALGGISEKVRHDVDGLLVTPHGSVDAWRGQLHRCVTDRALLPRLRGAIVPPRSLDDAAAEMFRMYRTVLDEHAAASVSGARPVTSGVPR
ncbi:MAG TPA: glycosyltransferase [Vicinamibacterales bacterium]|nr:glycosyltransferase [Vicinamibacterales bacterium]